MTEERNSVEHALRIPRWGVRDAHFGSSLVDQLARGRMLTPRQRYAAYTMLASYQEELTHAGVEYARIPIPERVDAAPKVGRVVDRLAKNALVVRFDFSAEVGAAIRALPDGHRWDGERKGWLVEITDDNLVALAAIVRKYGFTTTPAATEVLATADALAEQQALAAEALIAESIAASADFEVAGLVGDMRPYQRAATKYACAHPRTFIADEPGLGKTVEGIATVQARGAFPCVVVCPASVKTVWLRHWRSWVPGKRIEVIQGNAPSTNVQMNLLYSIGMDADVFVINYDVLHTWVPTLRARSPKAVILDESHYAKSPSARRTKAAHELAKGIETVLLLTGTPVMNRPAELQSQLAVMDMLGHFAKSGAEFMRLYGGVGKKPEEQAAGDRRSLVMLNDKLRQTCYVRRLKSQVLTELPPKQRSVIPIDLDNWKEYVAAESEVVRELLERHKDPAKARAQAIAEDLASIEKLKQLAVAGMMAGMTEWVEDFLGSGQKIILFGWHRAVVQQMAERFEGDFITGETPLRDRDRIVEDFQTKPEKRIVVGNMQAMGIGLTLTAASTVNFMELGWNPATHDQAEDRAHRLGQHDSVNANYFIGVGTIYERIMRLIDAKRVVVGATTDGRMQQGNQSILTELIADLTDGRVTYEKEEVPA